MFPVSQSIRKTRNRQGTNCVLDLLSAIDRGEVGAKKDDNDIPRCTPRLLIRGSLHVGGYEPRREHLKKVYHLLVVT